MAFGALAQSGTSVTSPGDGGNIPLSARADWVTIHSDLTATAATSTILRKPLTNASTNVIPVRLHPGATRVLLRARYAVGVTAMTTQPVVQVYSVFGQDSNTGTEAAPSFATDGTVRALRVDSATQAGTAQTLTIAPSTDNQDATYGYTDPVDLTGFDLKGGSFCFALVKTAAAIQTGSGAIVLQALFIN